MEFSHRLILNMSAGVVLTAGSLTSCAVIADDYDHKQDFGASIEQRLNKQAKRLFGFKKPIQASAAATDGPVRTLSQTAAAQILLAKGLKVEYLTRNAANATDMMAFFPLEKPTHLVSCVESSRAVIDTNANGTDKLNPSIQRINLKTGDVTTVLRGLNRCDGIRTTPWGTILATEESGDGGAYEVLNPLLTTELTIVARQASDFIDNNGNPVADEIAYRGALPTMAWEGLTVLENGVVIGGDELRPGTGIPDSDGGAIFKFLPTSPRAVGSTVNRLADSPLVAGNVFAMQVSCVNNRQQIGQGCEIGNAAWVPVNAATARADADQNNATGYYRPEDLHLDPTFSDSNNPDAIRFCWANTGNRGASHFGEIVCGIDSAPLTASSEQRTVVVNRLLEGDADLNAPDNLAFQPNTGILYVIEDNPNGDVHACLPDGADRNIKSDGCVKVLSVVDSSAEPTGFLFNDAGDTAYVSIQHSRDDLVPNVDSFATDDVLKITGFRQLNNTSKRQDRDDD